MPAAAGHIKMGEALQLDGALLSQEHLTESGHLRRWKALDWV